MTIFREYSKTGSQHSDRSAGDRARHRQIIKQSIKDNIPDIISEESIIGQSKDKIIKVPIRGKKEFRFVYGDNQKGVGTGDGNVKPGQVVGKTGDQQGEGQGQGQAGDQVGEDIYITEISLDEILQYLFEELKLPNMDKTHLKELINKSRLKKDGYRKVGIPVRLDKKKTAIQRIKRKKAIERHTEITEDCDLCEEGWIYTINENGDEPLSHVLCENCNGTGVVDKRIRFRNEDRVYKHMSPDPKPQSNAAIIFVLDTSGSMDTERKFLARSFFFLFYSFIKEKYDKSEVVFIAHSTEAKEVTEEQFFRKEAAGGTMLSSGILKAIEIIHQRYNPTIWNNYVYSLSDGDNFTSDNDKAVKAMRDLCDLCSLVGYGEIKPSSWASSSMMTLYKDKLQDKKNYKQVKIESKDDIWPKLKETLEIE